MKIAVDSRLMRYRPAVLLALLPLVLATCRAASPPVSRTPAPPGMPRSQLRPVTRRVVLLSVDGLAADRHRKLLARGAYSDEAGLLAFERWGYVVERAIPVDPSQTSVVHAAIGSGASPALTGIVSNRFHLPGAPISEGVSGFDSPWQTESLWQSFRRQGKRVGVLTYPGCDATSAERTADFGMTYVTAPFAEAATVELDSSQFVLTGEETVIGWSSFSPIRAAVLEIVLDIEGASSRSRFALAAVDTIDDGLEAYDTLAVDEDDDPTTPAAPVHPGEWFPLATRHPHPDGGERLVGSWCKLQRLDGDLARVRIYQGGFHATAAYPRELRERLDQEAGFWPGAPDDGQLAAGAFTPADYLAQASRFAAYFSACAQSVVAHESFDLLLAYQPVVDEAQHVFTIVDPRQPSYSEGLAATAAGVVDESYMIADRAVADLARAVDLSRDALVVVSDHGIAPVWEAVHVNEVLRRAGLLLGEQRNGRWMVSDGSQVVAFASGGCAHLYVNLKGREPTGLVPSSQRDDVIRAAAQALAAVEVDGVPAVEAMFRREELADHGLDSPHSGDLVAFMTPGFVASSQLGGALHQPAGTTGAHGYLTRHPSMHGVWMARGAGVPRARLTSVPLTRVAAFISRLGGVAPPAQAQPWP